MRRRHWTMAIKTVPCIVLLTPTLWGQSNIFPSFGNVGIGTTAPTSPLTLVSGVSSVVSLAIQNTPPTGYSQLGFQGTGRTYQVGVGNSSESYFGVANKFYVYDPGAAAMRLVLDSTGNVGIGTNNPQYKLSVHGTIQATEVIVNTGWSDYVFVPSYRLKPLREVAAYIQKNHHLPDVPSEKEVRERGVSLGEMQAKLLAKVEELTLHLIREDERNTRLEQENQELQRAIAAMRGDLDRIKPVRQSSGGER